MIGRDRREHTRLRESHRRSAADIIVGLVFVIALLAPLFLLLLFTLYLIKTEMGIDLFPEHLSQILDRL